MSDGIQSTVNGSHDLQIAPMSREQAFEILKSHLHGLERIGYDDYTNINVGLLARQRAQAIRVVLGMEAR